MVRSTRRKSVGSPAEEVTARDLAMVVLALTGITADVDDVDAVEPAARSRRGGARLDRLGQADTLDERRRRAHR